MYARTILAAILVLAGCSGTIDGGGQKPGQQQQGGQQKPGQQPGQGGQHGGQDR